MNLIAIETASGTPTACLWRDAAASLHWRGEPRAGPAPILAGVRGLLGEAGLGYGDLDAVACGRGPGAFTGVRLAISLAQGLALGIGCPVAAVSELAALAWRAHRRHGWERIVACIDARRGEVYWAAYESSGGLPRMVSGEAIAAPNDLALPPGRWAYAGSGLALIAPKGFADADSDLSADAEAVAALAAPMVANGEAMPAVAIEPAYLRERVASTRGKFRDFEEGPGE